MTTILGTLGRRRRALESIPFAFLAALSLSCAPGEGAPAPVTTSDAVASATLVKPRAEIEAAWAQAQTIADDMYASNRAAVYDMFHSVRLTTDWWTWSQDPLSFMNGVMLSTPDFESRLKIRELRLLDGPVTCGASLQGCTIFPAPLGVAASWDPDQAVAMYAAQGAEKKAKGANLSLSPTMQIVRDPRGGRNFESFSEDPYLSAQLAASAVTGIQQNNIIATAKHYVDNDQETNRDSIIVNVDDRTQHEIYLAPFKAAVDAGAGAFMCSYNRIATPTGSDFACENSYVLKTLLKGELGFRGFVLSDWGATHSGAKAANAGLDVEMNNNLWFLNLDGQITDATAREMARRIVFAHLITNLDDVPTAKVTKAQGVETRVVSTAANRETAQRTAEQSIVLLKNTAALLPLSKTNPNVAVLGQCAETNHVFQGKGSAEGLTTGKSIMTPRQAIANALGVSVGSLASGTEANIDAAVAAANGKAAAVVVLCATSMEGYGDGGDRGGLNFGAARSFSSANSDALATRVAATGTPTVVVVISPGQMTMPWAGNVRAILWGGLLGEMQAPAIARVLFGDVNPSGKLPITFGASLDDFPTRSSVYGNVTELFPGNGSNVYYREGLFVGYRHFDARNITPLFAFGHGLSYTTFGYANLSVTPTVNAQANEGVTVSLDLTNTGSRAGAEVVQVYLGFPAAAGEPPKVLRGFQKVSLNAGQTQRVSMTLAPDSYRYWSNGWVPAVGAFQVMVGSSSRDIRLTGSFQVTNGTPTTQTLTVSKMGQVTGTVTSTPAGISCGAACAASFTTGTVVTLSAAAVAGAAFGGWTGDCSGTASTCAVTMSGVRSVTATYIQLPPPWNLTVTRSGAGTGSVADAAGIINCGTTCSATLPGDVAIVLTATASAGSAFAGWSGACTGTAPTCTVSPSGNKTVDARFDPVAPSVNLTMGLLGAAVGTITTNPPGGDCGPGCKTFPVGTVVTLTAVPASGSAFAGWGGACTGTATTCTLTMSTSMSVTATFIVAPTSTLLSQGKPATASSTQSSSYPASNAVDASTTTRWASQNSNPQWIRVDLGQRATIDRVVLRWASTYGRSFQIQVSDDGTTWTSIYSTTAGTGGTQTLTVNGAGRYVRMYGTARSSSFSGYSLYDFQVWGTFAPVQTYTLTIVKSGTGQGTVTGTPGGISCGTSCSGTTATFAAGTVVTVDAVPASGSVFGGWSSCSGGPTCPITLNADQTIVVTFTAIANDIALTVTKAGSGSGTVGSIPTGINCGSSCSAIYQAGTAVTLTATPASGSTFTGWSGACTGTATTCVVTMNASVLVTATFDPVSTTTPCANPITFTSTTNNFNTTGAVCYRTSQTVNGWGCSNFAGRTVSVNGGAATATCGAGPFPLPKWSDGYTYFSATAGSYAWASIYVW